MKRFAILFTSLALAAGCGKSDDKSSGKTKELPAGAHKSESATPPAESAKPAKQPLTADFFGKSVALPGELAKLQWNMTADEARKAAPDIAPKKDGAYDLAHDAKIDGVTYGVGLGDKTNRIDKLSLQLKPEARALIEQAWGPGKPAKDSIGRERTVWFNPDTGWRASLEPGFGKDVNLELRPYLPVAKLLGDAPDKLGFAPDGVLGATIEELRQRFPTTLVETDEATAQAQQDQMAKATGIDVAKKVGKAQANVRLDLPPTEWGQFWTRVQLHFGKTGKVEDLWFDIPYGDHEPAKEELRALFEQHWGKPKKGKWIVTDVDVYRAKDPWIAVEDNTITKAWGVHVQPKAPAH